MPACLKDLSLAMSPVSVFGLAGRANSFQWHHVEERGHRRLMRCPCTISIRLPMATQVLGYGGVTALEFSLPVHVCNAADPSEAVPEGAPQLLQLAFQTVVGPPAKVSVLELPEPYFCCVV
ncbi:unnamed protein product [Heligmosomoides polygyrus]|uniref:Arrestin_C domain-containing protein n=1 Tax=Heligmosomoides polygyrus TaxID=6339 RepID=A0A183GQ08_HELPZ|nr:unnamed protein product [Heligmosomoides polygyrus]